MQSFQRQKRNSEGLNEEAGIYLTRRIDDNSLPKEPTPTSKNYMKYSKKLITNWIYKESLGSFASVPQNLGSSLD